VDPLAAPVVVRSPLRRLLQAFRLNSHERNQKSAEAVGLHVGFCLPLIAARAGSCLRTKAWL